MINVYPDYGQDGMFAIVSVDLFVSLSLSHMKVPLSLSQYSPPYR